jgi:hypothetical protein
VFLLDPRNANFVVGVSPLVWDWPRAHLWERVGPRLAFAALWSACGLLCLGLIAQYGAMLGLTLSVQVALAILGLWALILGVASLWLWRNYRHAQDLYRRICREDALVLRGRLVGARGIWWQGRHHVWAAYEFIGPQGRLLRGIAVVARPDLAQLPLPPSGAPVWVLYADLEAHTML